MGVGFPIVVRADLTPYKLEKVITGEALNEIVGALTTEHRAALLAAQDG